MMRKYLFLFAILISSIVASAQGLSNFLKDKKATTYWLGVDYSQVKLIGAGFEDIQDGNGLPVELKEKYVEGWNDLILKERDKYSFEKALRKDEVLTATKSTYERNKSMDLKKVMSENPQNLTEEDIKKYLSSINLGVNEGYGVMMIMENLDKGREIASLYFVIIDLSNKTPLKIEHFSSKPAGFGFRNYWSRPIYNALQDITKKQYKQWLK